MHKFLLLLSLVSFSAQAADTAYKTYVNGRYGFVIEYPVYLLPQGEAANGDGQVFVSRTEDAELRVYARSCIEGRDTTPAEFLAKADKEQKKDGKEITYRAKGKSFVLVSGTQGQKIFYEKVITDGNWCSMFQWTYASVNRAQYDEATKLIASSFKP
ncbi:hypothetical protein ACO0LC_05055 [Undibacterium sp. JH2W]|uniref:hypothetical protein n=1 Tax=Undibacterium sp. JH2W TaxID=3413037 RepID=UPI003BF3D3BC